MSKNVVAEIAESEADLISRAQTATSQCNWVVGECAHKWTQKYARGRTDGDFAALVGLSSDQVFQRRRVWNTFADVAANYPSLKWSHFYAAVNWDDAPECLQWADENQSTVGEMKAWRRALRGEDLTVEAPAEEWGADVTVAYVPSHDTPVRDPAAAGESDRRGRPSRSGDSSEERAGAEKVEAVARESADSGYAPFRSGAGSPPPKEGGTAVMPKSRVSPEQLITRVAGNLERVNAALTLEMLKAFKSLPESKRTRFVKAVSELSSKAARII
jgi:hypothetical protein